MVCENETLFIFAPCYGSITAQRYEIINKIGNKPISKIEILTITDMTAEQFKADAEALHAQKKEIERKEEALKQAYIDSLPFKVGDCVSFKKYRRTIDKAWITKIAVNAIYPEDVEIWYRQPKKDGTKSAREEHDIYVPISDITVINDTL